MNDTPLTSTQNNRCFSDYLTTAFKPKLFKQTINHICKICKHIGLDNFDAIAFRGMSGSMIAPSVALKLDKSMVLVRKTGDDCHSFHKTEGYPLVDRIVIIDDLISSGNTVRTLVETVNNTRTQHNYPPVKVSAIILYHTFDGYDCGYGFPDDTVTVFSFRYTATQFFYNQKTSLVLGLPSDQRSIDIS